MDNKVCDIFNQIHAEAELKEKTANFLCAEIRAQGSTKKVYRARLASVFASFAVLFAVGLLSFNVYFTANAYIDIDINPSIELTLNRFDRVIESVPYNDDSARILKEINLKHASYDKAVAMLLDAMAQNGYLNQDALLSVTVQETNGDESDLLIDVKSIVTASLQAHHSGTQAEVFSVTQDVKKHAHENHISPAKYLAISELQEVDPTISFDECKMHTISELKQMRNHHSDTHHSNGHHGDSSTPPVNGCGGFRNAQGFH